MKIDADTSILVLTGAGISAESGLATFRDSNGLWEGHEVEDVATFDGFKRDPDLVWKFYSERRQAALAAEPNAAHKFLVEVEKEIGDRFLLVTQNVDNLHRRAGSNRVIELHGNLFKTICSKCPVEFSREWDKELYLDGAPKCDDCGGHLRPEVVWFGEQLYDGDIQYVLRFIAKAGMKKLLFIAVGTSGNVFPASSFVTIAKTMGGSTLLVNKERANAQEFDQYMPGLATEILPTLFQG